MVLPCFRRRTLCASQQVINTWPEAMRLRIKSCRAGSSSDSDPNVVDADYKVVDDDNNK